jgi:hypothetical protein
MNFDVQHIRRQFPALKRKANGYQAAYLDGPGGTQVPQRVIDKVAEYLVQHPANLGWDSLPMTRRRKSTVRWKSLCHFEFELEWNRAGFLSRGGEWTDVDSWESQDSRLFSPQPFGELQESDS